MLTGQNLDESPIFEDLTLDKIIKTKQGRLVILHFDGSVSTIIPFQGINNTSFQENDYEEMFRRVQITMDEIQDPNITVQFLMVRDSNMQIHDSEQLPTFLRPRAQYLTSLAENYQLFVNKFYLSIHYSNKDLTKNQSLVKRVKSFLQKTQLKEENYDKAFMGVNDRVAEISKTYDMMVEMLSGMGAQYRVISDKKEIYDILQQFTRPSKSKDKLIDIEQTIASKESPRRQLFSGVRARVRENDFTLDDYYHKVWTLDRAPRDFLYGKSIEAIENVPFEFIYSVSFRLMTHKESMDLFRTTVMEKEAIEGSNKDAIAPDRSKTAELNRISRNYDQFVEGEGRGVSVSCNFVIRVKEAFIERLSNKMQIARDELIRKFDQDLTKKVFLRFGGSEWVNEQNTQWVVFNQLLPGCSNINSGLMKEMFLSTENIPYFFALYDNYQDLEHNGTNHFIDMRGNKFIFSIMHPLLPAWNYSISGQTGSGKSVLMNAILTMQFADLVKTGKSPIICILDVGGDTGSYTKFMELVKGTQINLSGAVKPRIQMLEIVPERSNPTPDKIDEIALVLSKDNPDLEYPQEELNIRVRSYYDEFIQKGGPNMNEYERQALFDKVFEVPYKDSYADILELKAGECEPALRSFNLIMSILDVILSSNVKEVDGFRNFDYDEISFFVREVYRVTKGRFPQLSDLVNLIESRITDKDGKVDGNGNKLLIKLKNWTVEGSYPMFDQSSNVKLENDVILADLKGLENEPQLQVVYTLLLSELFNNKMYFTKYRRKVMVRDEAWSLMKNARARSYFEEDLRTARKHGIATISISQLPTDYLKPDPDIGRAIMSNMQVNILCKFESDSICKQIGQELGLSPAIVEEMKSLGLQKEVAEDGSYRASYSKFMIVMGKSVYILKNILHPFEYSLYTSSAEDNAVIDYYKKTKQFENLEEILWYIARKHHVGDEGLIKFLETTGYSNKLKEVRGSKR